MVNILFSLKLRALEWFLPPSACDFISVFKIWSEQILMFLEHLADITIYNAERESCTESNSGVFFLAGSGGR